MKWVMRSHANSVPTVLPFLLETKALDCKVKKAIGGSPNKLPQYVVLNGHRRQP